MVDPGLIMRAIYWKTGRKVTNLVPNVWRNTKLIGFLAKCLDTVVLQRPQDLKRIGSGTIYMSCESTTVINGAATDFMKEARVGDYLILPKYRGSTATAKIGAIVSSSELILSKPFTPASNASQQLMLQRGINGRSARSSNSGCNYFLASKLDRSELFQTIADKLGSGSSLLMFPEGISHDIQGFLPFHGE